MEGYRRWKIGRCRLQDDSKRSKQRRRREEDDEKQVVEIIILSAQDLKKVSWFDKQEPYAVARIESCVTEGRTEADRIGGANPTWNTKVSFGVSAKVLERETASLTVDVYSKGLLWDNLVGSVRVLLSDLVKKESKYFRGSCLTFMVMRPSGRRHGLLNIGVPPKCFNLINSIKDGSSIAHAMAMQINQQKQQQHVQLQQQEEEEDESCDALALVASSSSSVEEDEEGSMHSASSFSIEETESVPDTLTDSIKVEEDQ